MTLRFEWTRSRMRRYIVHRDSIITSEIKIAYEENAHPAVSFIWPLHSLVKLNIYPYLYVMFHSWKSIENFKVNKKV